MATDGLRANERLDDLQHQGRFLIQREDVFCFGIDAVLLAHFPRLQGRERVLDLGTGTGVLPLLIAERAAQIEAVEIDAAMAEMAARSVALNGLAGKITVRQGDYRDMASLYPRESFDLVLANPPYYPLAHGRVNPNPCLARARHEVAASLFDVVRAARYALRFRGRLAMVHIPSRLDGIMAALAAAGLALKRAQLVQTRWDKPAHLVLLEAVVGSAAEAIRWLPTLCIYGDDGEYTPAVRAFYE